MTRENLIGGKGRLGSRPPQIVLASMEGSWPRRVGVLEAPSSLFFVLHGPFCPHPFFRSCRGTL